MFTFLKVQISSILGSFTDYLMTILLVEYFNCWYLISNLTGNTIGGITQFFLCRKWAFKCDDDKIRIQTLKFILVFSGNLILSAAGIYLLTSIFQINYLASKTIVSVVLGVSYNYIMQKKYVFT